MHGLQYEIQNSISDHDGVIGLEKGSSTCPIN